MFEHLKKHIQDVTDVLENHYETSLYHVDVMEAISKDVNKNKGEMDSIMREWLVDRLTPGTERLTTKLLSRDSEKIDPTKASERAYSQMHTKTSLWMKSEIESLKLTPESILEDAMNDATYLEQDRSFISQLGLCPEGRMDLPIETITEALSHIRSWNFDVIEFAKTTDSHPLYYVVMEVLQLSNVADDYCIGTAKLQRFLTKIDTRYCYKPDHENPYHNNIHGADVVQAVAHFMFDNPLKIWAKLLGRDKLALVIAAAIHDFRHKGVTNQYLVNKAVRAIVSCFQHDSCFQHE